ncbi:MAG: efflux RND transporter periplasmic adaptor subunit [Gemmatimonadetes bacterium]|nr:efflux RND transporter periplasmic adaptor subunit [Gemmatimonadota bacterium]
MMQKIAKHRWFVLLFLALFACGEEAQQAQGGRAGRGGRGGRGGGAAAPVKVETVKQGDISAYILKNTTLEAERWVDVRARRPGQVIAISKEEGDPVREGTVLARLDADAAQISVAQREVAYQEAKQRYEREDALFQRNLGSKQSYENAKTQFESAKAQLEQAKLDLSYTAIRSPIEGIMTLRNIEVGNMVTNNQVVASVAKFDPLLARIQVTEKDFGKITVGQTARITIEAAPEKEFTGTVKMISPVVDPESGTVKVTVEIPRTDKSLLRPGMFASVYIITETRINTLVIPKKALVLEGEGNQVFTFETDPETGRGQAQRRRIEIGFTDSDRLEILNGLSQGEQVITVGQEGLRPGSSVRLVGEAAPPALAGRGGQGRQGRGQMGQGGQGRQGRGRGGSVQMGEGGQRGGDGQGRQGRGRGQMGQGGQRGGGTMAGDDANTGQMGQRGQRGGGQQGRGQMGEGGQGRQGRGQMGQGGQGRGFAGGQGGGDPTDRIKRIIERFPEVKAEYEKRVKDDPELATNMEKLRAFVTEMREKGLIPARGGRGN